MRVKEITTNIDVDLNTKNFLASGGEGSVYKVGNKCYKIYTDHSKMLPTGKIQELQALHSKNVINPLSLLADTKGNYVGYSMNYVSDCLTLCSIFPQSFKDRNNIKLKEINKIVSSMKGIFEEFHKNKMLIVDANEYNFLVKDKLFNDIFLIDVDSCQTPSYPATAIMESIKDYHTTPFSPMSDWFSFAILTFQMYTGLHPFKGKHSTINAFPDKMKQNISVYDKDVTVPAFIKDFENKIPVNYNEWYKQIFTSKHRELPPSTFTDKIVKALKQVVAKIGNIEVTLEKSFTSNIISIFGTTVRKGDIVLVSDGLWIDDVCYPDVAPYAEILSIKKEMKNNVFSFIVKNKMLSVKDVINKTEISAQDISADHVISAAQNKTVEVNRVYIIFNNTISAVELSNRFDKVFVTKLVDIVAAYKVFPGVVFQPVLGTMYATLLRGLPGVMENIQINELADHRILNAELKENVLIVITEKQGALKRYIIRFDISEQYYSKYTVLVQDNIQDSEINFIVLDSGVCILSDINQGLLLFRNNPNDSTINRIDDAAVVGHKLYSKANTAFYADNNNLYKFKMK